MNSISRVLCIMLFAISALAHGADQSVNPVGKWKVKSVSVPATAPQAEKAKAMLMTASIDFSKDKTFAMSMGGPMNGTWKLTGHDVALTVMDMMGRKMTDFVAMARSNYEADPSARNKAILEELSKPLMAVLSADGKTLTLKPAPGKAGIVFVRR